MLRQRSVQPVVADTALTEASRPLGSVDNAIACPYHPIGVRLWVVNASHRHPDDKDDERNEVDPCADHIDPANDLRGLHRDETTNEQYRKQGEIDMPSLDRIAGKADGCRGEDHVGECVANGDRPCELS